MRSLKRIHETRARERKLKVELGQPVMSLGDEAIARRLSIYLAQKIRDASLPGATGARYGALGLPPLFRPAASWTEAEQRVVRQPDNQEESDHAE